MKALPHPPGTLWCGNIEVNGKETYVESYVKGDKLYFSIEKKLVVFAKELLLSKTLMDIGEQAVKSYEEAMNPKPKEEQKVQENAEIVREG